jgi:hypothetical protein
MQKGKHIRRTICFFGSFMILFALVSAVAGCGAGPSCNTVTGGPGTPSIAFTTVPPIGSTNNLQGQVLLVAPAGHYAAVYIEVNGGFWTKPYFDAPETKLSCNGTFTSDITTGGDDPQATRITAFLLPDDYEAPLLGGEESLPATLYSNAVATVSVNR